MTSRLLERLKLHSEYKTVLTCWLICGALLPFLAYRLMLTHVILAGLMFIILTAYSLGATAGFLSSVWAGGSVVLTHMNQGGEVSEVAAALAVYLIVAGFIGWGTEMHQKHKRDLKEREEYLQSLIEVIPDTLLIYDSEGRIVDVWTQSDSDLAAPAEEMIGQTVGDFGSTETVSLFKDRIQKVLVEGTMEVFEYSLQVLGGVREYEARLTSTENREVVAVIRNITDRKRAQRQLRRQTENLRERVKELNCLYSLAEMLSEGDLTRGEIILNSAADILPPSFVDPENTHVRLRYREHEFISKGFTETPHSISADIETEGKVTGRIEVHRRVDGCGGKTEQMFIPEEKRMLKAAANLLGEGLQRIRAAARLQENEQDLRVTLQSIGDGVIATDTEGRVKNMNLRAEELTGWSEGDARGRPIEDVLHIEEPRTGKRLDNPLRTVLQTGEPTRLPEETVLVSRDSGKRRFISDSAAPIKTTSGSLQGAVLVFSDETERYLAIEQLRASEEYNRSILELIPDILIRMSRQGDCLDVIASSEEKLYRPREELVGKNMAEVLPEDRAVALTDAIKESLQQDQLKTIEYPMSAPEGRLWFEARVIPADDDQVLALVRDITQRKRLQEKMFYFSFHDELTDLYNRAYVRSYIGEQLDVDGDLPVSIIMADLNGLKFINDSFGHSVGDEMLQLAAGIIETNCRNEDVVARWGGDEFVVILPRTSRSEAEVVMDRIEAACSEAEVSGTGLPLSLSLGTASRTEPGEDLEEVLKRAEARMYRKKLSNTRSARNGILSALLRTLEEKSHETREHIGRMQDTAIQLARRLDLESSEIERLKILVALHDIGKINVPEEILTKDGSLSEDEWDAVRKHTETGYRIASRTEEFTEVAREVLHHHECWDGSGYPDGLKGEDIPLLARIMSVVDAYDVMTEGRPYSPARSKEEALEELKRCAGTQFDPKLVEIFVSMMKNTLEG